MHVYRERGSAIVEAFSNERFGRSGVLLVDIVVDRRRRARD